ncbi:ficolin-1 [Drosophila erecta]|uniref:Fibrinogen C-terminal domain-containing protein n=1 Tax=Drosophila erecta TaxID=7220 RepID=B3N3N8_DROER|nr:ficolin-1 [Drosophila erecta]EDV57697.1 uncharacterized protein Dere_GG24980 [Drosophila erecta]
MLRLAIFCCLLVSSTSAKINETEICDDIAAIKAQVSNVLADLEAKFTFCEIAYPSSCSADSTNSSEILIRVPEYSVKPFEVACDQQNVGGGWTIILRRTDGSEDFYRGWADYKAGFGQLSNEFFLGLDKINALTNAKTQELLVMLQDFSGNEVYETFDNFRIGNEHSNYTLESIGTARGNAGDSLAYHVGKPFGTKDRYYGDPKHNCCDV